MQQSTTVSTPFGDVQVIVWATTCVVRAGGQDCDPITVNRVPLRFRLDIDHDGTVRHVSAERNEYDANRGYNGNQASFNARKKIASDVTAAVVAWLATDDGRAMVAAAQDDQHNKDLAQAHALVLKLRDDLATAEQQLALLTGRDA